jgi:hypothetical protein
MGMLKNAKHEQFAHEIANGLTREDAYACVYDKVDGKKQSAYRLLTRADIAARVEELRAGAERRVEEKIGVTKAWVIQELQAVHQAAVAKDNGSVSNRSLELIGKELGMFRDKVEVAGPDGQPVGKIEVVLVSPTPAVS